MGYSSMVYDAVARLTNLQHLNASNAIIANYTNTYDLASRITTEKLNGGAPTTYQYDSTSQLTNDSLVTYTFDLNGNRTMTGYSTGTGNQLVSDGTSSYSYDRNSNLIQKTIISTGGKPPFTVTTTATAWSPFRTRRQLACRCRQPTSMMLLGGGSKKM